ncbi:NAD(P)/FAD-dependent oxidoreductase [Anaerococcus octavius]|uniref:NAD(P)/FAD-dependent oxidoreductase n=1 Tax=Anaerococcus octavius TaxID=54007 RepID=UPI0027B896E8|nr:FAD-dependent oxidoreductase [Anaerococcus octavius]
MKTIVLAGGGHGHINILKKLIKNPIKDHKVILISDYDRQYYSGMLAGFIEDIYTEEEISFDIAKLCKMSGATYIKEEITTIDKKKQKVITKNNAYSFDYLSINLGSLSKINFPIDSKDVCLVKPILNVVSAKKEIDLLFKDKNNPQITFIGAGASDIELALSFKASFANADISIITAHDILSNFNKKTKKRFENILSSKDIRVIKDERVTELKNKKIFTNKNTYDFDYAFITSGFRGPNVNFDGYKTLDKNYIAVNDSLFVDNNVLAMGDVASIKKYPDMVKTGVYAIREAPFLYKNLLKLIWEDGDYEVYEPQEKYLQIINCGNKKALANYGGFSTYGKISWLIKDKIDRDYMKI